MWGECGSDDDYQSTSSSSDKRTTRVKKKRISRKELIRRAKLDTLIEVYNDNGFVELKSCDGRVFRVEVTNVCEDILSKIKKILKESDRIDLEYPITIHYKDK